jgi:beta-glucosidase
VPGMGQVIAGRARVCLPALCLGLAIGLGLLLTASSAWAGPCSSHSWCNRTLSPERRADLVLAAMTQQEKVDFLGGDDFKGGTSSGPDIHTGIQDGVPRLGVPTVNYADGPLGPRQGDSVGMPAPLGLAAAFDPGIARLYGIVVADEDKAKGNEVAFGPTINIMRTPLGGRTYEAYGEDPFLTARTAVGWIDGLQSQKVMADVKHFAENNQEGVDPTGNSNNGSKPIGAATIGSRYLVDVNVSDRTLHEVELRAFQAAIQQAHSATVMCSYNKVNGTYACENDMLLQKILRGQWGFRGYVLADYGAAHDTIASLNSGLDFEPWPPAAYQPTEINAAVTTHAVSEQRLNTHVRNVLATWFRYGIFDRAPYRNTNAINWKRDTRIAQRVEEQAVTLLRNKRHTLPLRANAIKRVAVIGKAAAGFVTGGGSGNVTPHKITTLLTGIKRQVAKHTVVTYDDGSNVTKAIADAKAAKVVIVAASDYYTEGADRSCLTLECPNNNGNQDALIAQVAAANRHTVVVLESGGPDLTPWRNRLGALLEAWYPGGPGGTAIARVLFGRANPGGRLPASFPAAANQVPEYGNSSAYPGINNEEYYKEGLLVGYRWYDAKHERPAYPFGFGLAYTSFRFSRLKVGKPHGPGGGFPVSVAVRNTGKHAGWAVPEIYVHVLAPAGLTAPRVQLEGYAKIFLGPGARRRVTVRLSSRSLSYWNSRSQRFEVQSGCYTIYVGSSSRALALRARVGRGEVKCAHRG